MNELRRNWRFILTEKFLVKRKVVKRRIMHAYTSALAKMRTAFVRERARKGILVPPPPLPIELHDPNQSFQGRV